jgi:hypothetical protein
MSFYSSSNFLFQSKEVSSLLKPLEGAACLGSHTPLPHLLLSTELTLLQPYWPFCSSSIILPISLSVGSSSALSSPDPLFLSNPSGSLSHLIQVLVKYDLYVKLSLNLLLKISLPTNTPALLMLQLAWFFIAVNTTYIIYLFIMFISPLPTLQCKLQKSSGLSLFWHCWMDLWHLVSVQNHLSRAGLDGRHL